MRRQPDQGAPIVGLSYDLCASLYEHVNRFPRAQRTLLGRVILDEGLRMLTALTLANRLADKTEALAEASGRLDALRITLRLAKRLGFLSNPGYESLTESADEIVVHHAPPAHECELVGGRCRDARIGREASATAGS